MEVQRPQTGTPSPPPGTGERGFDKLQNPGGVALIAASIILFAWLCFVGARWVRRVSQSDQAERARLRGELAEIERARTGANRPDSGA